jgi:hypothetical protein
MTQYVQDYDEFMPLIQYNITTLSNSCSPVSTGSGTCTVAATRYRWMDAIYPYIKSEKVFVCPDDLGTLGYNYIFNPGANGGAFGSYIANDAFFDNQPIAGGGPSGYPKQYGPLMWAKNNISDARPISVSEIVQTSQVIFSGDGANHSGGTWQQAFGFSPFTVAGTACDQRDLAKPPCVYAAPDWRGVPALWNNKIPPTDDSTSDGNPAYMGRHPGGMICLTFCDGHAKSMTPSQIAGTRGPNNFPVYLTIGGG